MRSETELTDTAYGFTWCLTDGQHYVRAPDGDIRAVNGQTVELLRLFATGELTREALCRQRDGGAAVLDEASAVGPETVIDLFDRYREGGFLRADEPVVRLHPPAEVRLWPRLLATLLPVGALVAVAVARAPAFRALAADPPSLWLVAALFPATLPFVAVHEFGHYAAASRHFESSVRIDTVNAVVPAFVTDTTGAWLLPRNRRLWINLAGPFAEAVAALPVAAAVAAGVGGTATLLVFGAVLANVVFALNPLFHGDGYWIASDLLGVENVRSRGVDAVRRGEPTWPAVYVVVSYAVGAAVVIQTVAVTVYAQGLRGVAYAAPVVVLLALAWADVEVRAG
jgi:hypothetical protein